MWFIQEYLKVTERRDFPRLAHRAICGNIETPRRIPFTLRNYGENQLVIRLCALGELTPGSVVITDRLEIAEAVCYLWLVKNVGLDAIFLRSGADICF